MKIINQIDWYKFLGYINLFLSTSTFIVYANLSIHQLIHGEEWVMWALIFQTILGALMLSKKEGV